MHAMFSMTASSPAIGAVLMVLVRSIRLHSPLAPDDLAQLTMRPFYPR
jgi:hypothetical protein